MIFFEKTNKLSNILFVLFALFLILTIVFFARSQFTEVLFDNFTNDLRGTVWMLVCLMIAIASLIAGISLKCLVRETNEELRMLEDRMKRGR
ncbi:hypothetical protein [Cohnella fermenti]|uniref:DUF1049 domain-containing protein n=1 Tax=Cohnella fermenti TaxID=2565925 RepID=A0A4V6RXH3_9BACL|nr:hypothetical protein [Cohnella fermenti]THF75705.1 hypothetical protein E6C55_20835 [Cohnella fermenti]